MEPQRSLNSQRDLAKKHKKARETFPDFKLLQSYSMMPA